MAAAPSAPPPRLREQDAGGDTGAEQYGPKRQHPSGVRVRLSPAEAQVVRYVVSEWTGHVGLRSTFGAMCERLAYLDVAGPDAPLEGEAIHVTTAHGSVDPDAMFLQERWSNERRDRHRQPTRQQEHRNAVIACWRAMRLLPLREQVTLHVLYGEQPPGLLPRGLWQRDVDAEYRRVAQYTAAYRAVCARHDLGVRVTITPCQRGKPGVATFQDESRGTTAFERAIDRKVVAPLVRAEHLRAVGVECEKRIVDATRAYWEAS